MKSIFTIITLTLLLNVFILMETGHTEHVPGEVLVKYKSGSAPHEMESLHYGIGAVKKKDFKKIRVQRLKLPDDMSVEEAIEYYEQDPNVEYAEPNYIVHANAAPRVTPNDPSFSNLWGLHYESNDNNNDKDIDAPEAWALTTGSTDVVIAVVDTGVAYNHPDLVANMWVNTVELNGIAGDDDDGNGYIDDIDGWDFLNDNNDPTDYNGHGTHVAGTIAAVGNNGLGITGVMWKAKIMPLRFLGIHGGGTTSDAVAAIFYASGKGAHIINNSWTGSGYSQTLKDAIDASSALVVCAAGNEAKNNDLSPSYPASYTSANIISVAATDQSDNLATFSNYGVSSVDIAAPGVSIYSSLPIFDFDTPVNVYPPPLADPVEDFEADSGDLPRLGWDRGGTNSTWAVTTNTGVGGSNSLEDSPGDLNYADSTDSWVGYTNGMTPITSVKNNIYTLSFKWKGTLENNQDFLDINYSTNGSTWNYVDYRTGTKGTFFSDTTTDLTIIAEINKEFYFGFGLYTDSSINYDGVYIDDVKLTRTPITIGSYSYANYNGTSMAAPHVAGVAGLIKALNPSYTNLQLKDAVLNSIEPNKNLVGKVTTGGRLNAHNALKSNSLPKLSISIVNSVVNLSWTDNSSDEEGFRIKKKSGDGDFIQIADVGANTTSYSDTSGVGGYYSINVYGGSFGDDAHSNIADVSSVAPPGSSGGGGGGGGGGGCFIGTASNGTFISSLLRGKD